MATLTSTVTQNLIIPKKMRGLFPNESTFAIALVANTPKTVPEYVARYFAQMRPHVFTANISTAKSGTEIITVGTDAVRSPVFPNAKWMQFMHEEAGANVWIGGSDVSAANGFAALAQYDTTERYPVGRNGNEFYLISDTAGVPVKVLWGEDSL
jgi:hypothetical protein